MLVLEVTFILKTSFSKHTFNLRKHGFEGDRSLMAVRGNLPTMHFHSCISSSRGSFVDMRKHGFEGERSSMTVYASVPVWPMGISPQQCTFI